MDVTYRSTIAVLAQLRIWPGTAIVEPYEVDGVRRAIDSYVSLHRIPDVRVDKKPFKPKAHFTITAPPYREAYACACKAVEWTAKDGTVALLLPGSWLPYAYCIYSPDVYRVAGMKEDVCWYLYGRKRGNRQFEL
jgi:hypothetical protein